MCVWGGGGDSHIKWVCMPMCRPRLKGRGLTELVGAFRADRTVKVVEPTCTFRADWAHSEKVGANRTEKVGALRANKLKKGGGGFT